MHPALRLIFRRRCLNFINVRTAYASKIQTPPTKKLSQSQAQRDSENTAYCKNKIEYFRKQKGIPG